MKVQVFYNKNYLINKIPSAVNIYLNLYEEHPFFSSSNPTPPPALIKYLQTQL